MSEKCYYGYVRPKLPNHPWSLEKIPLGKCIFRISKSSEVKSKKPVHFDIKVTDDIGSTLNQDGSFTLPIGKYLIDTYILAESSDPVSLNLGNYVVSSGVSSLLPISLRSMHVIEVTEVGKSVSLSNSGKDGIKVTDGLIVITKL